MTTDTPETDGQLYDPYVAGCYGTRSHDPYCMRKCSDGDWVSAEFARSLERQRDQARAALRASLEADEARSALTLFRVFGDENVSEADQASIGITLESANKAKREEFQRLRAAALGIEGMGNATANQGYKPHGNGRQA